MNDANVDIEMKDENKNEELKEEQHITMPQHNQPNIESKQGKLNNNLFKQLINIYHIPLNKKKKKHI